MDDYLDYISIGFSRAWQKSKSWLGVGSYVLMEVVGFIVYTSLNFDTFEIWQSVIVFLAMLLFTFSVFIVWELQFSFTQMIDIRKRNTMHGAIIEIWNNEVLDLTDLDVEIFEKKWITRTGVFPTKVKPSSRSLDLGNENKIRYHGGVKTVLVAVVKTKMRLFTLKNQK